MREKEPYLRGMWEYFLQERSRAKSFRELAEEEEQAGIRGQRQQESPARDYLEQVKCSHDTDCNEPKMKKGFTALKNGTWEEFYETFRKKMKASGLAFDRIKEAFELVAQDEAEKMSIVQEDHAQKHGFFAAHHRASRRTRRSDNVVLEPALQHFPFGRLRLVGLWEKIREVVVRNLWRKVRLEVAEQAFGRANWGKF